MAAKRSRHAFSGPVAKFFRARFVRELRFAEPAFAQSQVEIWPSEIRANNQKLGRIAFACSSHTGREKFATGPPRVRRQGSNAIIAEQARYPRYIGWCGPMDRPSRA